MIKQLREILGINFIECRVIGCNCGNEPIDENIFSECSDEDVNCEYYSQNQSFDDITCECNHKNQSLDDIICEITKLNPKLYYKNISKQKYYKQVKLMSKKNENTVLITDNKQIINEAINPGIPLKKHIMIHKKRCLLFDNNVKDNTYEPFLQILTGNIF